MGVNGANTNICIDCKKAFGGCPWSESFKPVPGWEAQKTVIRNNWKSPGTETYHITACPLFDRDEQRKPTVAGELGINELRMLLAVWKRRGE